MQVKAQVKVQAQVQVKVHVKVQVRGYFHLVLLQIVTAYKLTPEAVNSLH